MSFINWFGMVGLGFCIHWMINLTLRGRGNRQSDLVMGLNNFASILIIAGVMGPMFPLVGALTAGVSILIGIAVLLMAVFRFRENERITTMFTIGAMMDRGISLPPILRAMARDRYDETGRRCETLAAHLDAGVSLQQSLTMAGFRLPTESELAVQYSNDGEQFGRYLKASAKETVHGTVEINAIIQQLIYLTIVSMVGLFIVSFICLRIVPTFQAIFIDFGMTLPPFSEAVFGLAGQSGGLALVMFPIGLLMLIIAGLIGGYFVGWFVWEPALIQPWTNNYHSAIVQRHLALQTRLGTPIPVALSQLAQRYPRAHIRDRLRRAAHSVNSGEEFTEALRRQSLLRRSAARVIQSAQRAGNVDWALDEMADTTVRRLQSRLRALMRILLPGMVLLVALPIAAIAIAIFHPLSILVGGLS